MTSIKLPLNVGGKVATGYIVDVSIKLPFVLNVQINIIIRI